MRTIIGFLFGAFFVSITYLMDTLLIYKAVILFMRGIFAIIMCLMALRLVRVTKYRIIVMELGTFGGILMVNTVINQGEVFNAVLFALLFLAVPIFFLSFREKNLIVVLRGLELYYQLLIICNIAVFLVYNQSGGLYNQGGVRAYYLCGHVNSFVKIGLPGTALFALLDMQKMNRLSKKTVFYTILVLVILILMKSYVGLIGMMVYGIMLFIYCKQKKIADRIPTLTPLYLSLGIFIIICLLQLPEMTNMILNFGSLFQRTTSMSSRMQMWGQGLRAVQRNFVGYGYLSDFSKFIRIGSYFPSTTHNFYLDIAIQAGITGCVLIIFFLRTCMHRIKKTNYRCVIMPLMFSFGIMCNFEPFFGIETFGGIMILLSAMLALNPISE